MICYVLTSLVFLYQGNVKNSKKLMETFAIIEEHLHIFFSMKLTGEMYFIYFTLSRKDIIFWKNHKGSDGGGELGDW